MKFLKLVIVFLFFFLNVFSTNAQVVNAYARGTNVTGGVTIDVDNVDQSMDTYVIGEYVFIIQMQDDVIGTTADVAGFGDVGAINNAGRFEVRQIVNLIGGATPTQIVVDAPLTYAYTHGANSRFQVVSFPTFGAPNYTTTANMWARAWDGDTGGVLAFSCPGTLTLNHTLAAIARGFRPGGPNGGGAIGCTPGVYRIANGNNYADKGEGMYLISNPNYVAGRGRILNGGGGGNSHNGGGGGGGNYTNGGDGGPGWQGGFPGFCNPTAGGFGGYGLGVAGQNVISNTRLFMGGGGGAGEGNNGLATTGGTGGGIIFLQATEVTTAGCTGNVAITANGTASVLAAGNDGGGGGGAGGSIILEVDTWTVDPGCGCPLIIRANGGPGGDVANGATHGGGGGGGQGVIAFSNPTLPAGCVTVQTNNGAGGCNNNTNPCTFAAGNGGGTNNDGVLTGFTALPVEMGHYSAICSDGSRIISWETLSEENSDYFLLERSFDNIEWEDVQYVDAAGYSQNKIEYSVVDDEAPRNKTIYYKLRQFDKDGEHKDQFTVAVEDCNKNILVYPNPSNSMVTAEFEANERVEYTVFNMIGQAVQPGVQTLSDRFIFDFSGMAQGVYQMQFTRNGETEHHSVVIVAE